MKTNIQRAVSVEKQLRRAQMSGAQQCVRRFNLRFQTGTLTHRQFGENRVRLVRIQNA